jgi:DNA polymerase III subunit epsilon
VTKPPAAAAPALMARVTRELRAGPCHTLELARRALGLQGNPGVAARAVFALLGDDNRFQVSPEGEWRMVGVEAPPPTPPGPSLRTLPYAVVDVETTGGSFQRGHRVTEVAVVRVVEGRITDRFVTLVNPERPIPPRIQALTGITDEMVAGAPCFQSVAREVADRLRGGIFVAHNVSFDWGFVSGELEATLGGVPGEDRLCTVRMGRLLVPGLRSYSLDPLTRHFGIRIDGRHRAGGDALATARLLLHLVGEAEARGLHDRASLDLALASRRGRRRERTSDT